MAVKTKGLDILTSKLSELASEIGGDLPDRMLDAGAETAEDNWREGILAAGHVESGDMLRSVGTSPYPYSREIYPQGTDRKGVRNAEKAFVINYGKNGKKGDRFADKIQKKNEKECYRAMAAVYDEALKKITN